MKEPEEPESPAQNSDLSPSEHRAHPRPPRPVSAPDITNAHMGVIGGIHTFGHIPCHKINKAQLS